MNIYSRRLEQTTFSDAFFLPAFKDQIISPSRNAFWIFGLQIQGRAERLSFIASHFNAFATFTLHTQDREEILSVILKYLRHLLCKSKIRQRCHYILSHI